MSCSWQATCGPYTTNTPGACDTGTGAGGGCSASGVHSGAGNMNAVQVLVVLLALAAFRTMRRRFA
jgi:MYXO-CTERM domain-containing protein